MLPGHRAIPALLRGADWCTPCHTHCGGSPSVLCACCRAAAPASALEEKPVAGKHERPEQDRQQGERIEISEDDGLAPRERADLIAKGQDKASAEASEVKGLELRDGEPPADTPS